MRIIFVTFVSLSHDRLTQNIPIQNIIKKSYKNSFHLKYQSLLDTHSCLFCEYNVTGCGIFITQEGCYSRLKMLFIDLVHHDIKRALPFNDSVSKFQSWCFSWNVTCMNAEMSFYLTRFLETFVTIFADMNSPLFCDSHFLVDQHMLLQGPSFLECFHTDLKTKS